MDIQLQQQTTIQQQIFARLLDDGNALILAPEDARRLISPARAEEDERRIGHNGQAFLARRLASRGLRPIKVRGRWAFALSEIARWLADPGAAQAQAALQPVGSVVKRRPGRPRKTKTATAMGVSNG